jgi:hypothetical protein
VDHYQSWLGQLERWPSLYPKTCSNCSLYTAL